jgi:lantibiotic modifying enzyme
MEKTLQKIANLLILNLQNAENLGLSNGRMGIAVFLYHYARYASQPVYSDQADDMLDELFAALNTGSMPPLLTSDVAGIALGLSYLIQNHFVETDENVNELFKDVNLRLSKDLGGQSLSDI